MILVDKKKAKASLAGEKPPIFGRLQRDGEVVIAMLPNVQRVTIEPLIQHTIQAGYTHKTVNHSAGEYARDEDGDGFHEVHVNTLEGFWSLLRSWLRPHRGLSQEKLPLYLGFFEFVHNVRRRGKALLASLLAILVAP
jgi:transposase-like protein